MTIVPGIEGLNPPIPVPPSLKFVYPRFKTEYRPEYMKIDDDMNEFLNRKFYEGIALVTFGNVRQPPAFDLDNIAEYCLRNSKMGFIVALNNP